MFHVGALSIPIVSLLFFSDDVHSSYVFDIIPTSFPNLFIQAKNPFIKFRNPFIKPEDFLLMSSHNQNARLTIKTSLLAYFPNKLKDLH